MSYPSGLRDLLRDLAFYNLTKENEKICFATNTTVSSTSPLGWIYRRWYGEGTPRLISKTTSLINRAVEALDMEEWSKYRPDIFAQLIEMDSTIRKQLEVYDNDNEVKAELATSRRQIAHILEGISLEEKTIVDTLKTQSNFDVGSVSPGNRRSQAVQSVTQPTLSPSSSPELSPTSSLVCPIPTKVSPTVFGCSNIPSSSATSLNDDDLLSLINQSGRPGSAPIPIRR